MDDRPKKNERFEAARKALGFTQDHLIVMVPTSRGTLTQIEKYGQVPKNAARRRRFAEVLQVPEAELWPGVPEGS